MKNLIIMIIIAVALLNCVAAIVSPPKNRKIYSLFAVFFVLAMITLTLI